MAFTPTSTAPLPNAILMQPVDWTWTTLWRAARSTAATVEPAVSARGTGSPLAGIRRVTGGAD